MADSKKITYEFLTKDKLVAFRISSDLYKHLQKLARKKAVPTQKCIREAIERYLINEKDEE